MTADPVGMNLDETLTIHLVDPDAWRRLVDQWQESRWSNDASLATPAGSGVRTVAPLPQCPVCQRTPREVLGGNPHPLEGAPGPAVFNPCGHQILIPDHGPVPGWRHEHIGCDWTPEGEHVADRYKRADGTVYTAAPQPLPEGADVVTSTHRRDARRAP